MHTLTPTKDTGATAKANEVVYVELERTETDQGLENQLGLDGVNAAFVADFLSACLTHERCGTHLYRSVAARTANPMLQGRYEQFGRETMRHVEILEDVITAGGGNPSYVSPLARATETADTKALEATYLGSGGIDPIAAEMAMLDAVFMAETVDEANWEALGQLAAALPDGPLSESLTAAVREVVEDEHDHLSWARDTRARLTMLQVSSSAVTQAMATAEELVARVKGWFGDSDSTIGDADERPTAATVSRKAAAKNAGATKKGAASKKSASKKKAATSKKAAAGKKSTGSKKSTASKKKPASKKASSKKAASKKAASKKSSTKKSGAKKAAKRRS